MTSESLPVMPSPFRESIRIKDCARKCGISTEERLTEAASFNNRVIKFWSSAWAGDVCPNCLERDRIAEQAAAAARALEANQKKLADMLGGPKLVDEYTLDRAQETFTLEKAEAVAAVREFKPDAEDLYFYGPAGTGKTHLAVALAQDQCRRGRSVAFFTPGSLMREFRKRLDPEKEERFLKFLSLVEVLVIDDLGVGKGSEYAMEKFQEIIDGRDKNYRHGLVITSNLSLNGIAEVYKDRIPDRLNGLCRKLKLEGPSFRSVKK